MNPWFYQQPISPTPIHTSYPPLYLFHRRQTGSKHPLNKTYNCSGPPAFKRQRARCQSNQKLMHHYEHLNNQLDSLFFLKIQQILRSHEPKGLSLPFLTRPNLIFLNLYNDEKKSIYSVSETQSLLESRDWTGHTHLWPCRPDLYQHVKNQFITSVHSSHAVNFTVLSRD